MCRGLAGYILGREKPGSRSSGVPAGCPVPGLCRVRLVRGSPGRGPPGERSAWARPPVPGPPVRGAPRRGRRYAGHRPSGWPGPPPRSRPAGRAESPWSGTGLVTAAAPGEVVRHGEAFGRFAAKPCRHGGRQQRLPLSRGGDRCGEHRPQRRIARGELQFDVAFHQFVTEFVVPGRHRGPGHRVGHRAVRTDDQQRIRLAAALSPSTRAQCSRMARKAASRGFPGPSGRPLSRA